MIINTEGIVLRQIKYGDSSSILKIYTRLRGVQSFMVRGMRKVGSKQKSALFFPLTELDITAHIEKNQLHYLKEVKLAYPYQSLYMDIRKSGIAVFLSEMLNKCLNEGESDNKLFDYIWYSLREFDASKENFNADFHLYFLFDLSAFLGFYPRREENDKSKLFDMREGCFCVEPPSHLDYLNENMASLFRCFLLWKEQQEKGMLEQGNERPQLNLSQRQQVLRCIVQYYRIQLPIIGEVKSMEILQEVFHG
ncbi:MAG: DNA repair protein RecO [Bacteroidales bacterium]